MAAHAAVNAFDNWGFTTASRVKLVGAGNEQRLIDALGETVALNGRHWVVEHEGLFYDVLTGSKGRTWEDYTGLWRTTITRAH